MTAKDGGGEDWPTVKIAPREQPSDTLCAAVAEISNGSL